MAASGVPTPSVSRLWLLIPAACLVPAVLDGFQAYMQARLDGQPTSWQFVIFSGTEWLFLAALTPIAYYLGRRLPLRRETLGRTLAIHLGGALLLCIGWASLGVALRYVLGMVGPNNPLPKHLASWMLTSLPWSVFMYFTVLGCVYAFIYFSEAREREAQAARLAAQLAESRLSALRMQLHPHFLFNSLNAIGVLVRDQKTAAATRMIELLGDVLHTVLRSDSRHEIPLHEEIAFLEQYLAIEQVRFSDRLHVQWQIDDELRDALVPEFVLQPLVENALRHGIAKRSDSGMLEISARRDGNSLVLTVSDDGAGLPESLEPRMGVGLTNVRERLRTLYGDAAQLDIAPRAGGGVVATVVLPFRSGVQDA
jgi:two-component system, LytTR family, sensor kinase